MFVLWGAGAGKWTRTRTVDAEIKRQREEVQLLRHEQDRRSDDAGQSVQKHFRCSVHSVQHDNVPRCRSPRRGVAATSGV
ncbi:hypothetical protein GCM10010095_21440 [Streptomyces anthocyanicus]|nr:hypothetical protein GCM10010095_21440 [Streptomyces anthocyanicus]